MIRRVVRVVLAVVSVSVVFASGLHAAPVKLDDEPPKQIVRLDGGGVLVDFGRVAFGNLKLLAPEGAAGTVTVHFGEKLADGRVDRKPPGTVRYKAATCELRGGGPQVVAPEADSRNTEKTSKAHPPAILTPKEWGVVLPFRWVEIEGWPGELRPDDVVRRAAFAASWDNDAASFTCSDEMLNEIWELCRFSIKATTFAGVYVDGDRERIPCEADAYLNQLSHYTTDRDSQMARDTFDWLMDHGTWPTEWAPHMVFMAHADWMRTGDKAWLAARYERLKTKTLAERAGPDGLVRSNQEQQRKTDIVDWPKGERDGYVFTETNTVVNAFFLAALSRMAEMGDAIGNTGDADDFRARFAKGCAEFQRQLFDTKAGLYRDGVGTDHCSLHANLFPLAFGLVPEEHRAGIVKWLGSRGMRCSVYAAQYLLEGLFQNGGDTKAIELIAADNDRSWRHMVKSGTTITWEAWDLKYKPNQDWNHAWGAAPANLLPRFVLGVEPLEAGWGRGIIRPCEGGLRFARGKVPTPRGPIEIDWKRDGGFQMKVSLPEGVRGHVEVPAGAATEQVFVNGGRVDATRKGDRWVLADTITGTVTINVQ
jgi:hypothetical protein